MAATSSPRLARRFGANVTDRIASSATAASWLTVMRWHAVGGQAAAVVIATQALHIALPRAALLACIAALTASNIGLEIATRRGAEVGNRLIAGALIFDIAILTIELALSGGATNPFAIFLLVPILLAGLLLPARSVIGITVATAAGYACLAAWPCSRLPEDEGAGRWMAFGILAFFMAHVTWRTANALRMEHAELLRKQRIASHAEKLASLGTLAAGAAHELGSPLGTITVAAEELDAIIVESPEHAIEDARVIREEVARCREIVHRMNARAGQLLGELPEPTTTLAILTSLEAQASPTERARLVFKTDASEPIECPSAGLVRILHNLVSNALHASEDIGTHVVVTARSAGDRIRFIVDDRGRGIPANVRSRLGEPFVTTKPPGKGMGLGLFLSFAFAELCAGELTFAKREGGGTRAVLELPRRAPVKP